MNRKELWICILFIEAAFSVTALAQITVSVSPKLAEVVVTTQKQQFRATVTGDPNNLGVTWTVDGVIGGNATVGEISAAGLYTSPAKAGSHVVTAHSIADNTKSGSATIKITDLSGVLTYHNNRSRDGANTREYALSPRTVSQTTFGKRFSCTLDGAAYTQPLWMPHLSIGGTIRNLVFVGTEHDTAYAFDADHIPCLKIWHEKRPGKNARRRLEISASLRSRPPRAGIRSTAHFPRGRFLRNAMKRPSGDHAGL